jgi:hypothetical protein
MVDVALLGKQTRPDEVWHLQGDGPYAKNTFDQPREITPSLSAHSQNTVAYPPHSVTMVLFNNGTGKPGAEHIRKPIDGSGLDGQELSD